MKPNTEKKKDGYREPNKYEKFDDILREAMKPSRKARRYS
jgi:hypothetical protein